MNRIVLLLIGLILFGSCQRSNTEIVSARQWKAKSKPLLGDVMVFSQKNNRLYVSNDTIYKDGKPAALVISTTYDIDHYVLTLHSIDHKQTGTYIDNGRAE